MTARDHTSSLGPAPAMVISALSFSLMGICVKQVGGRIPAAEVVLARSVVNLALSWWQLRRAGIRPWGQRRGLLVWRGSIGSVALFCVYVALSELPLASATVLQYLYPTFTALLAWLMLGEPIGRRVLAAVAVGWLGVLLVARPAGLP
ncbi:MAG: DMT family transporter, partial [Prochlorococcaceae cyanobacterium]